MLFLKYLLICSIFFLGVSIGWYLDVKKNWNNPPFFWLLGAFTTIVTITVGILLFQN